MPLFRSRPRHRGRALLSCGGLALLLAAGRLAAQSPDPLAQARASLSRGDVRAAVAAADKVLQRDPLRRDALALKIEALATAKDWESALAPYERYVAAGGAEDAGLLKEIARAALWESAAFFPSLRPAALGRLACGGDRQALAELRRYTEAGRPEDVDPLVLKARLGDFDAVLALREFATNAPPGLRPVGLQALQQLRDRGATRPVAAALAHEDLSLRLAGARAARILAPPAVKPQLVPLVADPNPLIQAEARAALAVLGDRDQAAALRPLLKSPIPDLRLAAIAGLLALEGPDPRLLDALVQVAEMRTSIVWPQAIELLFTHAPDRAAAAVQRALADPNANSRIQGLRFFTRLPDPDGDTLRRLRELLKDPNTFVRVEAAAALAGRPSLCAP